MQNFGRYTASSYNAQTPLDIDIGMNWQFIRIINNSAYMLSVDFAGMGVIDMPECYLEDYTVTPNFRGKITIKPTANLSIISSAPSNLISVNAFLPGEIMSPQAQPLTFVSAVGNTVSTTGGISTAIQNDGNTANTSVIETTVSGDATSCVKLSNDGVFSIGNATHKGSISFDNAKITSDGNGDFTVGGNETVTGTVGVTGNTSLSTVSTSGLATLNSSSITNNETVNGNLTVKGTSSLDNGNITTNGSGQVTLASHLVLPNNVALQAKDSGAVARDLLSVDGSNHSIVKGVTGGDEIHFILSNGSDVAKINSSGISLLGGAFQFLTGSMTRINGGVIACGSGTTISHGLGVTPDLISGTPVGNQPFSATVGIGNAGSSTFQATVGSGSQIDWTAIKG